MWNENLKNRSIVKCSSESNFKNASEEIEIRTEALEIYRFFCFSEIFDITIDVAK